MTASLLIATTVPLLQHLFPPMPLAEQAQLTPTLIFGVLEFCLAAAYLALWRAAPDYRVFRTMGLFLAVLGVEQVFRYFGEGVPALTLRPLVFAMLVETAGEAIRIPHRRWTWLFWPAYLYSTIAAWFPSGVSEAEWAIDASQLAIAILVIQGLRSGNQRDRKIAAIFGVYFLVRMPISPAFQRLTSIRDYIQVAGWQWRSTNIMLTILAVMTLAIFVRDLIRDREEKRRMAAELEAARSVQQVLIPEKVPQVAGFAIQSVYKPAGQVGGDFFQIMPLENRGVLVVIGDVSGKGMGAAMTVSLLVGTVRTLAHYTRSPGEILAAMNQRMLARSHGGFTTCLVLRADTDGSVTVANAGHIAPYLAGKELQLENALPLGLAAESAYSEISFRLALGEQLTLVTDGVVEARDKDGTLFGFDRTAAISVESAENIAQVAQAFGQDDDITVLTVQAVPR
jgi:Stage II sporulation protein E (SpoIIE)